MAELAVVRRRYAHPVNRTLLVLLILLTAFFAGALKAVEKNDLSGFYGSTVKPAWIAKSLSLEKLESIVHTGRIQQIIAFSKMQVDDSNPWIIDGVKGTGPMPQAYFKAKITELLQDDPQLVRLRRETRPGDQLFQFDSARTSERVGEGFIAVRDGQVVFEWWTAIH